MFGMTPTTLARQRMYALLASQQKPGQMQPGTGLAPVNPFAPPMVQRTAAPGTPAPAQPTPPTVDPFMDAGVDVPARRLTPDDSPLAMDQSAKVFQARKPSFLNQLGFLAQAFDEGPRGYTEGRQAWSDRQRQQWTEQRTADARSTAIQAVRMILARDTDPLVRQVAQVAGTPEAFMQWYTDWKDKGETRARQDRELDQGDTRLKLQETEIGNNFTLGRASNSTARYDAETRRKVAEDQMGSRDPVERGLIANDVDQVQKFSDAASTLGGLVPDLKAFIDYNTAEPGTGAGSFASWFPFVNNETQQMRQITTRLAPALRAAGTGAMSDKDMDMLLQQVPNTGRSRQSNAEIIGRFLTASQRASEREYYARQYLQRDRSLATFNRLWSAYINDASIAEGDTRNFGQWLAETQAKARAAAGGGAAR